MIRLYTLSKFILLQYLTLSTFCFSQESTQSLTQPVQPKSTGDKNTQASPTRPNSSPYSLGISLLGPTGISFSKESADMESIAAAFAWDLDSSLYIHTDFLKRFDLKQKLDRHRMYYYYGVGLKFKQEEKKKNCSNCEDTIMGIRVPIGLYLQMRKEPFHFFGEISVGLKLVPSTMIDIDIGLGGRYRF